MDDPTVPRLPYPFQGQLVGALRERAITQGRFDLISLWSGQAAPLVRHHRAGELFEDLIAGTQAIFEGRGTATRPSGTSRTESTR